MSSVARGPCIVIGGTEERPDSTQIFMRRLSSLWPDTGLGALILLPANTGAPRDPREASAPVRRWWRTHLRNGRVIRQMAAMRGLRRTTVWYHYGNGMDLLAVGLLSLVPGIRLVVTPHCTVTRRHLSHPFGRWFARTILRRADLLLVLSREQLDFFPRRWSRRVRRIRTLLPQPAGALPFRARPAGSLIFAGGRVAQEKGVRDMVELLRILHATGREFTLEIFGRIEPDMEEFLAQLRRSEPVARSIRVHGAVPAETIAEQLATRRYLLYLSRVDAFPAAVLEAVVAGAVPVVYRLPGMSEIIERWGGLMARPGDLDRLASAICAIEAQEREPALRSSEAAEYYSAANVVRELREILGD